MIGFSVDKGEILHNWIFWHLGLIYLQDNSRRTSSSLTTDSNNGNDLSLYKRLVSSAKRKNSTLHEEAEISLMYNKNNSGPRTDPWRYTTSYCFLFRNLSFNLCCLESPC